RVASWPRAEHPFQRRVRDQAAVPKIFVADLSGRETRRQRARSGDMFERDLMRGRIEISEVAAMHFDRADAKAHLAGIDTVEIDDTLQRRAQWAVVVITRFIKATGWPQRGRRPTRHEKVRRAEQKDARGTH